MPFLTQSEYRRTPSAQFIASIAAIPHRAEYDFDRTATGAIKDMCARSLSFYSTVSGSWLGTIEYRNAGVFANVRRPGQ